MLRVENWQCRCCSVKHSSRNLPRAAGGGGRRVDLDGPVEFLEGGGGKRAPRDAAGEVDAAGNDGACLRGGGGSRGAPPLPRPPRPPRPPRLPRPPRGGGGGSRGIDAKSYHSLQSPNMYMCMRTGDQLIAFVILHVHV